MDREPGQRYLAQPQFWRETGGLRRSPQRDTTQQEDFVLPYVTDLRNVVDMEAIRAARLKLAVDPLGGAAVHYWEPINTIYKLDFLRVGSMTKLVVALRSEGITTKGGKLIDKGYIYRSLNNRVYLGEAVHKGTAYAGEHKSIIDRTLWDRVHAILRESPRKRAAHTRAQTPALLKGLIFGPTGRAMTPAHTRKGGKLYRYYVSTDVLKRDAEACPVRASRRLRSRTQSLIS